MVAFVYETVIIGHVPWGIIWEVRKELARGTVRLKDLTVSAGKFTQVLSTLLDLTMRSAE